MGRKIPGRKHRGVKDPEKQRRERFNRIKNKINLAPSNPDIQETPHSITKLAKIKEEFKNKNPIKSKPKKLKRPTSFVQKKGENKRQFLHRVHKACEAVIQENAFENKYGVNVKRNPETGKVEGLVKKPKDEIDVLMKKMKKQKNTKGKRKLEVNAPVLTKSQKHSKKLKEKKQRKALLGNDFESKSDIIKFGEVAHAPPTLSTPRNVPKVSTAARPGQKELLLTSLMQKKEQSTISTSSNKINKVINKSGKRKDLPNALRRKLEQQQTEIIKAYRLLKKQKHESSDL